MKPETLLEIQAYADGELEAARRAEVERLLQADPSARALHKELCQMRAAVQAHEPAGRVADSREFYWSQIQRRIAAEDTAAARQPKAAPVFHWLRWLAPILGVAALALIFTLRSGAPSSLANASAMTFRSDNDGLTIHWIN